MKEYTIQHNNKSCTVIIKDRDRALGVYVHAEMYSSFVREKDDSSCRQNIYCELHDICGTVAV